MGIVFVAVIYWLLLYEVTQYLRSHWSSNCFGADTCDASSANEDPSTAIRLVIVLVTNVIAFILSFTFQVIFKMIYDRIWPVDFEDDDEYYEFFGDEEDDAVAALAEELTPASIELRTIDQVFGFTEGTFAYRLYNDDDLLDPYVDRGLTYDLLFCNLSHDGEWPDVTLYIEDYLSRTPSWTADDAVNAENVFREARIRQITSRDLGYDEFDGESGAGEVMFLLEGFDDVYEVTDYLMDDY